MQKKKVTAQNNHDMEKLAVTAYDQLLRNSLPAFVAETFATVEPVSYIHNWHVDYVCEYLKAVIDGDIKRLIINMPPGFGKTVTVSIAFPAFVLGHKPSTRIMSISHTSNFSCKISNKCKKVMQSEWYRKIFPETIISDQENRENFYKTTQKGHRQATSIDSKVTGEGADLLSFDDPIDSKDANNITGVKLQAVNDAYDQKFYNRLRDKKNGAIVVMMQRLMENDLCGHLMDNQYDQYTECIVPFIEDNPGGKVYSFRNFSFSRKENEFLCEEMEAEAEMLALKERLGTYGFEGQYQQRPAPKDGGVFKKAWFGEYESERKYIMILQSWDTAYKPKEHNDPSVCITFGMHESGLDVLNVWRERKEYPALKKKAIQIGQDYKDKYYDAGCGFTILIEDKASGQSLIQDMRQETNLPIIAITPEVDKLTRAHTASPLVEAGKVSLPKDAIWKEVFLQEILTFDNSKHDDQVDAFTQCLNWYSRQGISQITDSIQENIQDNSHMEERTW